MELPVGISGWTSLAKDAANILFFLVVGIITLLTYRRARDTLLAPMRAEVFKSQLKELNEVFSFLRSVKEADPFDFGGIVYVNSESLMSAYVQAKFPGKLERNERFKEIQKRVVGHLISADCYGRRWRYPAPRKNTAEPEPPIPPWSEYTHDVVDLTKDHVDSVRQLDRFVGSPFLPVELRPILDELRTQVHSNLTTIRSVMTAAAQDLPQLYQSADDVYDSNLAWIHNKYNSVKVDLQKVVAEAMSFVDAYLGAGTLLPRNRSSRAEGRSG